MPQRRLAADEAVLQRTGWHERMAKGWNGCRFCAKSLLPANATGAVYDENGMLKNQRGRDGAARRLARTPNSSAELPLNVGRQFDVYQFGVLTGGGLRAWVSGFRSHRLRFGHLYGFDSFQGLPDSDVAKHEESELRDLNWQRGGMNAAETLALRLGSSAFSFSVLRGHILKHVGYDNATLIRGYYNESLPRLPAATRRRMCEIGSRSLWQSLLLLSASPSVSAPPRYAPVPPRRQPAMLVDLDCDLYESSMEAFDFLVANGELHVGCSVLRIGVSVARSSPVTPQLCSCQAARSTLTTGSAAARACARRTMSSRASTASSGGCSRCSRRTCRCPSCSRLCG